MRLRDLLFSAVICLLAATGASAQDAAKVDPAHYKVESENATVRILRVHYGPHEKSVMHSHPASVVVYLTDGTTRFHFPNGKFEDVKGKAGETNYSAPQVHNPENIGNSAFDAIVIELKGAKPTGGMSAKK